VKVKVKVTARDPEEKNGTTTFAAVLVVTLGIVAADVAVSRARHIPMQTKWARVDFCTVYSGWRCLAYP